MGLLNAEERRQLSDLLLELWGLVGPQTQQMLLGNLPLKMRSIVPQNSQPFTSIQQIISTLDGPIDRNTARLSDGRWPIVIMLADACYLAQGSEIEHELRRLYREAQLRATQHALGWSASQPAQAPALPVLEKIVNGAGRFSNVGEWMRRLTLAVGRVCRVELPRGAARGTGFLLAPQLVLTNYHVVQEVLEGQRAFGDLVVRFGYQSADQPGTVHRLAAAPLLSSPDTELDFALLQLEDAPAVVLPPGVQWQPPQTALEQGQTLFILQHPDGRPLEVAAGHLEELDLRERRVRYRVDTQPGSSGSPCFDDRWDLVALHHAAHGSTDTNQGIPVTAILERPDMRAVLQSQGA